MKPRLTIFEPSESGPPYDAELCDSFITCLMWQGRRGTARRVFNRALDQIRRRMPRTDPLEVLTQAVENVKPSVEMRSKRVSGAIYEVPTQVTKTRQRSLAIRWIIGAARSKKTGPMYFRLADEIMAAYRRDSKSLK